MDSFEHSRGKFSFRVKLREKQKSRWGIDTLGEAG